MSPGHSLDDGETVRGFRGGQQVFGRFTLVRLLGRGGMGVVWQARDERLETDIALKFLPELVAHDPSAIHDLKRETRRSLQLTHPNIVRIFDFLSDERASAVAMELVDGATLAQLRLEKPHQVFDCAALEGWVRELCTALDYAHTHPKIVHRDLKPANLMVGSRGELKLTDFGISATLSDSATRVSQVGTSGTLVYMSPQQLMGEPPSVPDDIYALGATLYELLTGKPPFYSGDVATQVRTVRPVSIAERRRQLEVEGDPVPEAWERVIAACLAKEAAGRPASARAVAASLFDGAPLAGAADARRVKAGAPRSQTASGAHRGRAGLLWAGGAIAVAAVTAWMFLGRTQPAGPVVATPVEATPRTAAPAATTAAALPAPPESKTSAMDLVAMETKLAVAEGALEALRKTENPYLRRKFAEVEALSRRAAEHKAGKAFDAARQIYDELEKAFAELAGLGSAWRDAEEQRNEWLRRAGAATLIDQTQHRKLDEAVAPAAGELATGRFAEAAKRWRESLAELDRLETEEKARLAAEQSQRERIELERKREEAVQRWAEKFEKEPVVKITASPTGYPQGMKPGGLFVGNSQSTNGWERMTNSFDKTFTDRMGRPQIFSWTNEYNGEIKRGGFSGGGRQGDDRYTVNFNGVEHTKEFSGREWKFDGVLGWLRSLTFGEYRVQVDGRRMQYSLEIDFSIFMPVTESEKQAIREKQHPKIPDAEYGF
jgi:hypothetical protein